jgi:hypothetical protein
MIESISNPISLPDGSIALPIDLYESLEIYDKAISFFGFLYYKQIARVHHDDFEGILLAIERYLYLTNEATIKELENEFNVWYAELNPVPAPYRILTVIAFLVADMHAAICEENVKVFWWQSDSEKTLSMQYYRKLIDLEVAIRNYRYTAECGQPLLPDLDFYRIESYKKDGVKVSFTTDLPGYRLQ